MGIREKTWRIRAARERITERSSMWVAWHLPHRIVMWCYVRVGAYATAGQYENTLVSELTMMDALKRWEDLA